MTALPSFFFVAFLWLACEATKVEDADELSSDAGSFENDALWCKQGNEEGCRVN
jgi:hypothetical protein